MKDQVFYATAAQVLPVLMLALMFERRYFESRNSEPWMSFWFVALLVAMGGGLLIAINSLVENDPPPHYARTVVLTGLDLGVIALIGPLLFEHVRKAATALPGWARTSSRLLSYVGVLAALVLMFVFDATAVLSATLLAVFLVYMVVGFALQDWQELQTRRQKRGRVEDDEDD